MKFKLEATIPTTQYGNIRPTFEVETDDEVEEAQESLKKLWNRFGETPLKDKQGGGKRIETYTGEVVFFNEDTHSYTDEAGNVLLSGSKYAEKFSPKFDLEMMVPKTASAWKVSEESLRDVWKMNSEVSTNWGTAIHLALELYQKHLQEFADVPNKKDATASYVTPKNKFLRSIVESFVDRFGVAYKTEVVISDVQNKMVGTVDHLSVTDGVYRIGDYKTNAEMDAKKLLKYQKQLSFYAHILKNKGFNVGGLDLYYLDDEFNWVHNQMEILDLE